MTTFVQVTAPQMSSDGKIIKGTSAKYWALPVDGIADGVVIQFNGQCRVVVIDSDKKFRHGLSVCTPQQAVERKWLKPDELSDMNNTTLDELIQRTIYYVRCRTRYRFLVRACVQI